jgi:hypothetical protein
MADGPKFSAESPSTPSVFILGDNEMELAYIDKF